MTGQQWHESWGQVCWDRTARTVMDRRAGTGQRERTIGIISQDKKERTGCSHDIKEKTAETRQPRRDNSGSTAMTEHSGHDTGTEQQRRVGVDKLAWQELWT